ncbi:MAG TPA: DUF3341 domain-containing protein [Tepidisphaeraceae bacterium]|nr:DUF3341 domain-containing protein [Tepidisphaeraceae bacterium]
MSTVIEPDMQDLPVLGAEPTQLIGLLAEYTSVDDVIEAASVVRKARFARWDVHSPFPIHGIDHVMGVRPTGLPWLVLIGGLFGLFGGLWLQWFCNAYDYPILISGKPYWSLPANIPIIFECTVLCASITATVGMFGLNRLPQLSNPLFKSERFRRVTDDRFFIVIDASDREFDEARTTELLNNTGAVAVERVED